MKSSRGLGSPPAHTPASRVPPGRTLAHRTPAWGRGPQLPTDLTVSKSTSSFQKIIFGASQGSIPNSDMSFISVLSPFGKQVGGRGGTTNK